MQELTHKAYSDALIDLGKEHKLLKRFKDESIIISQAMFLNRRFEELLRSPSISLSEKLEIAEQTFGKCNELFKNTIKLLIKKNKARHIQRTFENVHAKACKELGIALAKIESVQKLTDKNIKELENFYSKKLNKPVEVIHTLNPNLVSGIRVTVDGKLYDGTIKGRVEQIRSELLG